jgi:uncharacterized protein YdhG (YjbR/CyaY superfamily)
MGSRKVFETVDSYINSFPEPVKRMLDELRRIIKSVVPEAEERISYNMPAFFLNGALVYFAGCKNHIGFYPTGDGISHFVRELNGYVYSKGAVRFPLDQPVPEKLIVEIVAYRKSRNLEKK